MSENRSFMATMNLTDGLIWKLGRRLAIFLLAVCCTHSLAAEGDSDFSGAWAATICPPGSRNDPGKCSNFVLELFQHQNRLCGSHIFATSGAAQLDEGGVPSLSGTIDDEGTATVMVESGRAAPLVRVRVELKITSGLLQWRRLQNPEGDYLLPLATQLRKSRHGTFFSPLFGQMLKAVCSALPNAPANNSASPPSR